MPTEPVRVKPSREDRLIDSISNSSKLKHPIGGAPGAVTDVRREVNKPPLVGVTSPPVGAHHKVTMEDHQKEDLSRYLVK
jgi:hypothetical protein